MKRINLIISSGIIGICLCISTVILLLGNNSKLDIFVLSWMANLVFFSLCWIIYIIENHRIGLVFIVIIFCFLFNFGQPLLWSFGIHTSQEIGTTKLFSNFSVPTREEIVKTIVYSLFSFTIMGAGILCSYKIKLLNLNEKLKIDTLDLKMSIYRITKYVSMVVIPLAFFKVFLMIWTSLFNGYASIYYSDFVVPSFLNRAENLFFPLFIYLFIGAKPVHKKKLLYLFCVYMILNIIAGERGNWIYGLCVLVWYNIFYHPIINIRAVKKRLIFFILLILFLLLHLMSAIIDLRGLGLANVSIITFFEAAFSKSPVISFVSEMGNSMGVTLIVLTLGRDVFLGLGNTFLSSMLASLSSSLASFVGVNAVFLGNYLSQDVLHINYGTGFNIFAESFLNGGYFFGMTYTFIIGILIGILFKNSRELDENKDYIKLCISCYLIPVIAAMMRDSSLTPFKSFVQIGCLLPLAFYVIYFIEIKFKAKKNGK